VANTGALFVAIPSAEDPINEISQEDIAHCTLTYFGDAADLAQVLQDDLRDAGDLAASEVEPFTVKVSGVALLGEDKASVLLLESQELVELRKWLNSHPAVDMAVRQAEQFPWWVPHLTIGYNTGILEDPPETITFDRLGLWLGESKESYDLHGQPHLAVAASALCIPTISCREDLPLGVRYGNQVPAAQWYVTKRAHALGAAEYLPISWSAR
jgi:2'-5' RNA ligase